MPLEEISTNTKRVATPQQDPQSLQDGYDDYERWLRNRLTTVQTNIARNRGIIASQDQTDDTTENPDDAAMETGVLLPNDEFKSDPQRFKAGGMRQALKDNMLEYY